MPHHPSAFRWFHAILLACLMSAGVASAKSTSTVRVEPAKAVILLPEDADNIQRDAAAELAKHLKLITGQDIATMRQADPIGDAGRFIFHVGPRPADDQVPFLADEARWRVTPQGAWFYGGPRYGVLFAVYDFLESQLGVRWIEPGDRGIAFDQQNPLEIEQAYQSWQPRFMFRKIRQSTRRTKGPMRIPANIEEFKAFAWTVEQNNATAKDEEQWQLRMRMSGQRPGGAHAFSDWWGKYGKTHPEYFALTEKGTRDVVMLENRTKENSEEWVKICPSNPAVARQLVENWLPSKDRMMYLSAGPNDGLEHFCRCENCLALDARKPGEAFTDHLTDRYVHLANEVARQARQHRPDAKVAMYAYLSTLQPPRRIKLEPNVVIHIVPYLDPLDLQTVETLFKGWHDMGATMIALRPNYHFKYASNTLPVGIEKQMFDVFQQAVKYGAISFDYDSLTCRWPVTGLMDYVLAKAMSDPLKPFEYWVDHYARAFGPAAAEVKVYHRYWREELWEKRLLPDIIPLSNRGGAGSFDRGLMWALGDYYQPADFDKALAILKPAMAYDLSDTQRRKLNELILATEHARLVYDAVVARNVAKREPAQKLVAFRKAHKGDLSYNWLGVFSQEVTLGDITGLKLSQLADDYIDPWIATDETWQFRIDPQDQGLSQSWQKLDWASLSQWERIATTAFWENQAKLPSLKPETQALLTAKYDGIGWYATRIQIPADYKGKAVYLRFDAVDESCWVHLNGRFAGEHLFKNPNDWKTPFEIRIDNLIDWSAQFQDVVVRVQDRSGVGGIWKPVWIVTKKQAD